MNPRAVEARVLAIAPWLLALSLVGQLTMVAFQTQMTMIDLMVYRNGSPELFTGFLYDWRLSEFSDKFALPFTYPPFSALVFVPLSWIPWGVARWFWQILCLACLYWLIRTALRMIDAEHLSRRAMLWTALAIWVEPVRTTLNYGQINLLLAAVLLATMASTRPWVAGFGVGVTAGIKLTPAVSGVYFLGTKRFAAAVWSVVAFGLTVGLGFLVAPQLSGEYWFHLLGDASRIGPVGSSINQSLRGALSRTVGYDVQSGPIYLAGCAVAVVLMVWALREALRAKQTLAAIVVVQVFGLLVSPISWSHHWVWAMPALMWLLYGPANRHRLVNTTAVVWVLSIGSFLISFLLIWQDSIWTIPRPWWESLLGWVYPAAGLLTLVAVAVGLRALEPGPRTEAEISSPVSEPQPADRR
ncbi:mannosyltransferase [Umezawaea tangerina]|uniref:Alpha-1,2-mannosyltransferase n=1 Tax=Umezawaea tangerina TaxID=84725 RepID=A0A2T0TMA6_9PSEU|nr:mannosyltransferase [Umezawaea tangerina]PRY46751.1 alpha-1,2-mannosyltransferase [Umezawaea tangerina]